VLAVPLVLLTLIAAYFCRMALTISPSGSWDDDAYAGIVLSCVLTIGAMGDGRLSGVDSRAGAVGRARCSPIRPRIGQVVVKTAHSRTLAY
jgi:hypothetical protein